MANGTKSVQLRNKGNDHFRSASDSFAAVIRIPRLRKALNCYKDAHACALNEEEVASAAKNTAMALSKIAQLTVQNVPQYSVTDLKEDFRQAFKYFGIALNSGKKCGKPVVWVDNITATCRDCWDCCKTMLDSKFSKDRPAHVLSTVHIIYCVPIDDVKAECLMEIAEIHFDMGMKCLIEGKYKQCLNHMKECHQPMHDAKTFGSSLPHTMQAFEVLESDIQMHTCQAEAMQSREIGDQLLGKVLNEDTINMNMVWEIIDWYKDSIIKVRELDLRQEAISVSRIGIVYDKVIRLKYNAREYLKKAMELAQTFEKSDFVTEKWYQDCVTILERYQKETIQHEQEQELEKKLQAKKSIAGDLENLKKHELDGNIAFLQFVYKEYKPKNPAYTLDSDEESQRKLFQKAVVHYHPDRIDVDKYGLNAKVLFEEITKCLTRRYEALKGLF